MNCTILSLLVFNEKDQTIFLNFALHAHAYIDNEKVWRGLILVILDIFFQFRYWRNSVNKLLNFFLSVNSQTLQMLG